MDAFPPTIDLSQTPLAAHPSGIPPNFVDPPSLIAAVQAIGITLGLISFALVVLRLVICYQVKRPIGLDDVCVVIAFVLAAGYTGISCSLDKVTRHAWDTPLSFLDAAYLKKLFVTSLFYGPMLFFAKASILLLYYRAFHPERWLRIGVYITLAILFTSYFMTVPLCFTYCMPHNGNAWDFAVLANCNHLAIPGLVQAGMNMAADVTIFLLPLPIIAKLHIPMGKKIALAGVFATGVFALVASVLTVYYRVRIIRGFDTSWAGAQTYICIQAEIYASISVACMPLLAKIWKMRFTETRLYKTMQSFLSLVKGESSFKSTGNSIVVNESTAGWQRSGYCEIHHSDEPGAAREGHGIYKMMTVELTSMKSPRR